MHVLLSRDELMLRFPMRVLHRMIEISLNRSCSHSLVDDLAPHMTLLVYDLVDDLIAFVAESHDA